MTQEELTTAKELLQKIVNSCKERENHYRGLYINKQSNTFDEEDIQNSKKSILFWDIYKKLNEAILSIDNLESNKELWNNE